MKTIFFLIFLLNIYRMAGNSKISDDNDVKSKMNIDFQNDIKNQDKRSVGNLTILEKENKKFLRVEFSDIMRIPEIHLNKIVEIDQEEETYVQDIAHKVISDFIKFEDNFQNEFVILDIFGVSDLIENFFKSKALELNNSNGSNVELSCEIEFNDENNFLLQKCVDKNNDGAKFIDYEIKIVDTKYYMINLKTIYGSFEILIPVFLGNERINEKLENLYEEINEKQIENILSSNNIVELIQEKIKKYQNCFVFVKKNIPTVKILTILDEEEYNYRQEESMESQIESGIDEEDRKLKKIQKLNNLKKNKERKLEGECILMDTQIILIDLDITNYQNYHLKLSYQYDYISEHLLVKQNSEDFKNELNSTLDEYFSELDKVIENKKKKENETKAEDDEDEIKDVLKIEDFENKIKEKFPNFIEEKEGNKIVYSENGETLLEVFDKSEDSENFEILFSYPKNNKLGSKAHSGITININKDLEHFQFFENELEKLSKAIARRKILV